VTDRPRRGLRRIITVLAGLAAASVALSGCLYAQIPVERPAATRTADTTDVPADLVPFYSQKLDWSSCGAGFDCTKVKAPLDWENPGDGDISLAVVRHRATGASLGSLLINPGGPGGSGYDFVHDSLDYAVGATLIKDFDVIGFDPRGVGRSTAVKCLDAKAMDGFNYGAISEPRNTPAWEDAVKAQDKVFADACKANSGGILPFITTVDSARDMDLIRGVLGDRTLNYLGYSYGTFLGATYAKLYPQRAQRLVLDGAMDPTVPSLQVGTAQAIGFESSLRAYMKSCLADSGCPFNGTVEEALSDVRALLATVSRTPLKNADGRVLSVDSMITGMIAALYSQDSWTYLTRGFTSALQGNASVMMALADSYNGRASDGTYTDNTTEAFQAYNCMDYPLDDSAAAEDAAVKVLEAQAPTFAPYWQGPDLCEEWPYPPTGAREAITAAGSGPIVVVGTTNDPATPYVWAESLAKQLENGTLITRVGEGHTGYNKGNSCVDDAVEAFLTRGSVPKNGLRCE
jgi:pimeloyl-ACP methyl ester carboxylesterase